MIEVSEIADRFNALALELCREFLPNGRQAGTKYMCSGVADHGRSESMYVHLSGPKVGRWFDMGNAAPGEDKGDMLDLVRIKLGLDARGAVEEAKRRLGIHDEFKPGARAPDPLEQQRRAAAARARVEALEARDAAERERKAKGARALYLKGGPIAGTPVDLYLQGRALAAGTHWPNALRFHAEVFNKAESVKMPAMLAPIYDAGGTQIGTHRTYLQHHDRRGWIKIDSPNAKMVLGNMWGGFIPINKGSSGKSMAQMPEGEPVYITEGIEDALVVRMMKPGARIVAAISLPNMGGIVLPPAARKVVLVCDRDSNARAQEALERAIAKQQARGLDVQLVMPPAPFKDMNDWLRGWLAQREGRAA